MTKILTFSDQPFSFSHWNCIFGAKNNNFLSQVKILVVLHQLQKEWILFYLKWAWNECLHLKTSEMSISMGSSVVHCFLAFVRWNSYNLFIFSIVTMASVSRCRTMIEGTSSPVSIKRKICNPLGLPDSTYISVNMTRRAFIPFWILLPNFLPTNMVTSQLRPHIL